MNSRPRIDDIDRYSHQRESTILSVIMNYHSSRKKSEKHLVLGKRTFVGPFSFGEVFQ